MQKGNNLCRVEIQIHRKKLSVVGFFSPELLNDALLSVLISQRILR